MSDPREARPAGPPEPPVGAVEICAEFGVDDYLMGYVCAAPRQKCMPTITVTADGVWFREHRWHGRLAAHRGCLDIDPTS